MSAATLQQTGIRKRTRLPQLPLTRVLHPQAPKIREVCHLKTFWSDSKRWGGQNGKRYIVAFTMSDDTSILKTHRINDRYTNKGGKQIWPDTSDT